MHEPPQSFSCAPDGDAWLVVGALDRQVGELLVTKIVVAELHQRFGDVDGQQTSGDVVLRSGRRIAFERFESAGGYVAVRMVVAAGELPGGRVELRIGKAI